MPNLTLEYTCNLPAVDMHAVLTDCTRVLAESGQFTELDIKTRAIRIDEFVIGTAPGDRAFVYATLSLLSGRAPEIKREMSRRLLGVLQNYFPVREGLLIQLAVELQDMDRDSFSKVVLGA